MTITSSSSIPKSGVGLRSRRRGFLLERCERRGTLAPPTPTRPAPNVRISTPFDGREPKLCPWPVPHLASSPLLAPVSSAALLLPLPVLWTEEPVARPLRELPAPRKAGGGWASEPREGARYNESNTFDTD